MSFSYVFLCREMIDFWEITMLDGAPSLNPTL
jgi:hypothetical protein